MVIKQKHLIEFQIYYLMVIFGLVQVFHIPTFFEYVLDANVLVLFMLALPKVINMITDKITSTFNIYVLLYMVATVFVALARSVPAGQIVWAARNNYFYLIFFLFCCFTLKTNDVIRIMDNVCRFQAVNCVFVVYEHFILGKNQDFLGGMFGIEKGCNGALNIYLVIISAYSISRFSNKKISIASIAFILLSSVVIAALSELKFFYIELILIIALFLLFNRMSLKNLFVFIGALAVFFVAYRVLMHFDNDSLQMMLSSEKMSEYASNDYGTMRITRARAIEQINQWCFGSNKKLHLFGYGLGACEESKSFSWANSSFANVYKKTLYRSLSSSMLYLELGWTGLIAFSSIFIGIFTIIFKNRKYFAENKQLAIFSQIMCVLVMVNIWYNDCIRSSIAYLTYITLAGAIICIRDEYKKELLNNPNKNLKETTV